MKFKGYSLIKGVLESRFFFRGRWSHGYTNWKRSGHMLLQLRRGMKGRRSDTLPAEADWDEPSRNSKPLITEHGAGNKGTIPDFGVTV